MEDKEGQDGLDSLLNSMGISDGNKVEDRKLPDVYKECDILYFSEHKKMGLPIYLGVIKKSNRFLIGFGDDDPLSVTQQEMIYMMVGIGSLVSKVLKTETTIGSVTDLENIVKQMTGDIKFKSGSVPHSGAASASKGSDDGIEIPDELNEEATEKLNELQDSLEEVKNMSEQVDKYTEDMTPAERKDYIITLNKKHEDLLAKKAREFERSLLGSIEEEENVTYNYEYFKKVHEQQGQAALKEELAKLPKEERHEIIAKIITEAKLKQQKPNNNDEKVN